MFTALLHLDFSSGLEEPMLLSHNCVVSYTEHARLHWQISASSAVVLYSLQTPPPRPTITMMVDAPSHFPATDILQQLGPGDTHHSCQCATRDTRYEVFTDHEQLSYDARQPCIQAKTLATKYQGYGCKANGTRTVSKAGA